MHRPTRHPAVIGHISGRPVFAIMGGDGTGDPPPAPSADPPTPPADPPPDPPDTGTDDDKTDWKAEAEKWKAQARKHEQRAKGNRDQADKLGKVAKALGLDDPTALDPDKLAADRDQASALAWRRSVELAVHRAAGKAGADPDALLDSRGFIDSLDDLVDDDPSDAEFAGKVEAAIKAAVKRNPKLKAATAAASRSGPDHPGSPGTPGVITEDQLARMSPDEIVKALNEGRLKHLL